MGIRSTLYQHVHALRGRRTMQASRQMLEANARAVAMVGSASINASKKWTESLDRMSRRLTRFAQISSFILTGTLVRDFFRVGIEFEKAMSGVQAVSRGTERAFGRLGRRAEQLGAKTIFTAAEVGQAMEELAKAGFSVAEVYEVIDDTVNLAAAGMLDVGDAATITSGIMRGMGIDTKEFTNAVDVLTFTANNSAQTISDLGKAFSFVGPVAKEIGVDFTELTAAMGLLANRNLRAERSGTALRRILRIFMGDLETGEAGLAKFNVNVRDAEGNFVGLAEAMRRVVEAGAQPFDILKAFGDRAGPAALALAPLSDELDRFSAEIARAAKETDVAGETAEKRLDNLSGDLTKLANAWRRVSLEIYQQIVPALRGAVQSMTEFLNSLDERRIVQISNALERLTKMLLAFVAVLVGARLKAGLTGLYAWLQRINITVVTSQKGFAKLSKNVTFFTKRLGLMGVAFIAVIGEMSYQLTRFVLEMTGWDSHIQSFFERFTIGQATIARDADSVAATLGTVLRGAKDLEEQTGLSTGLKVLDKEGRANLELLLKAFRADGGMGGPRQAGERLLQATEKIVQTAGVLAEQRREIRRFAEEFPEQWAKALEGSKTIPEAIEKANRLIQEHTKNLEDQADAISKEIARIVQLQEKAAKEIKKILEGEGFFDEASLRDQALRFETFMEAVGNDSEKMKAVSVELRNEIKALQKAFSRMGELDPVLENFSNLINRLWMVGDAAERAEDRSERLESIWDNTKDAVYSFGLVTHEQLQQFAEDITASFDLTAERGENVRNVFEANAEAIVDMIDRAREAGESIPEDLAKIEAAARSTLAIQEFKAEFDTLHEEMRDQMLGFQEKWMRNWEFLGLQTISTFADMVGQFAVEGGKGLDMLRKFGETVFARLIALAVEHGLQMIFVRKKGIAAISAEHAAQLSGSLAAVYAQSFQSAAAIPLVGWAIAPGIAAANLGIAVAASTAAMATGAKLGASAGSTAGGIAFAEGGIADKPISGVFGEAGREAVIPLTNPRARKAFQDLGLTGMGEHIEIHVHQTFTGDNWSESGVRETIITDIHDGLLRAIRSGTMRPLPTRSR